MVLFLAIRNLLRSRTRTLLLWVGISVSGALLYDMVMLAGGLETSFSIVLKQMNFDLRMTPRGMLPFSSDAVVHGGTAMLAEIRTDPRIESVRGFYGTTLFWRRSARDAPAPAFVLASRERVPEIFRVTRGDRDAATGRRSVALSEHLAVSSHSGPGDSLLISGPPSGAALRGDEAVQLPVGAIGEFRFDAPGQNSLLVPFDVALRLRGTEALDPLSLVAIRLHQASEAPAVARDFRRRFPQCEVYETRDLLKRLRGQLSYFSQFSAILGSMSFIVAWLLITTLLVLSQNDRVGEFAVLRAVGLKPGRLVQVALLESLAFVLISVPSGLLLGLFVAGRLDALLLRGPGLPVNLHFFVATSAATWKTVALLFLAGALGALYPVLRVARLPIAATLHEAAL